MSRKTKLITFLGAAAMLCSLSTISNAMNPGESSKEERRAAKSRARAERLNAAPIARRKVAEANQSLKREARVARLRSEREKAIIKADQERIQAITEKHNKLIQPFIAKFAPLNLSEDEERKFYANSQGCFGILGKDVKRKLVRDSFKVLTIQEMVNICKTSKGMRKMVLEEFRYINSFGGTYVFPHLKAAGLTHRNNLTWSQRIEGRSHHVESFIVFPFEVMTERQIIKVQEHRLKAYRLGETAPTSENVTTEIDNLKLIYPVRKALSKDRCEDLLLSGNGTAIRQKMQQLSQDKKYDELRELAREWLVHPIIISSYITNSQQCSDLINNPQFTLLINKFKEIGMNQNFRRGEITNLIHSPEIMNIINSPELTDLIKKFWESK